jgi:hypothetical protein
MDMFMRVQAWFCGVDFPEIASGSSRFGNRVKQDA